MPGRRHRTVAGVEIRILGDSAYEFETNEGFDYHVRKEQGAWVLDAFDAAEADPDTAWVLGDRFSTLTEAVEFAKVVSDGNTAS